jgi:hypothetical protein
MAGGVIGIGSSRSAKAAGIFADAQQGLLDSIVSEVRPDETGRDPAQVLADQDEDGRPGGRLAAGGQISEGGRKATWWVRDHA